MIKTYLKGDQTMKKFLSLLLAVIMMVSCFAVYSFAENEAEPSVMLGDINGDKRINLTDLSALMKYLAKWDIYTHYPNFTLEAAEVTHDGEVNLQDATRLMKYIAGWGR